MINQILHVKKKRSCSLLIEFGKRNVINVIRLEFKTEARDIN